MGFTTFLFLMSLPAYTEDVKESALEAKETKWEFILIPYLWTVGINGDVTVKGNNVDVDVGFDEILDNLDFAALGQFIAKRGRWEFFVQPNSMNLSPEGEVHRKVIDIDADVETKMLLLEFGTSYRLGTWGHTAPVSVDLLGGRKILACS